MSTLYFPPPPTTYTSSSSNHATGSNRRSKNRLSHALTFPALPSPSEAFAPLLRSGTSLQKRIHERKKSLSTVSSISFSSLLPSSHSHRTPLKSEISKPILSPNRAGGFGDGAAIYSPNPGVFSVEGVVNGLPRSPRPPVRPASPPTQGCRAGGCGDLRLYSAFDPRPVPESYHDAVNHGCDDGCQQQQQRYLQQQEQRDEQRYDYPYQVMDEEEEQDLDNPSEAYYRNITSSPPPPPPQGPTPSSTVQNPSSLLPSSLSSSSSQNQQTRKKKQPPSALLLVEKEASDWRVLSVQSPWNPKESVDFPFQLEDDGSHGSDASGGEGAYGGGGTIAERRAARRRGGGGD